MGSASNCITRALGSGGRHVAADHRALHTATFTLRCGRSPRYLLGHRWGACRASQCRRCIVELTRHIIERYGDSGDINRHVVASSIPLKFSLRFCVPSSSHGVACEHIHPCINYHHHHRGQQVFRPRQRPKGARWNSRCSDDFI